MPPYWSELPLGNYDAFYGMFHPNVDHKVDESNALIQPCPQIYPSNSSLDFQTSIPNATFENPLKRFDYRDRHTRTFKKS